MARRRRYLNVLALGLILLGLDARSAQAVDEAAAESAGNGVNVIFMRQQNGEVVGQPRSGHSDCDWHAAVFNGTAPYGDNSIELRAGPRPSEQHELYLVWCGENSTFMWLGPNNFADTAVRPVADELIRRITVLPANVDIRPDNRGVTGIPSMFWVEGYGTQPLTATESAFGLTVVVNVQLVEVEWDFGDGTPVVQAGLGEAWPDRSSVQHAYKNTSGAQPYTVTATLLFQPTYTVNGVAGPTLDPIQIPVTRPYVVHQVQAQRVR